MEFVSATPSVVKSIKQRGMLNLWLRKYCKQNLVPLFDEFQIDRLADHLDDMVFYSVGSDQDSIRFLIDRDGQRSSQAYGDTGKGRYLDDYLPLRLRSVVLPIYFECVNRGLPIYTIAKVRDVDGIIVDFERLLLPFRQERRISRIAAILNAVSIDGRFEIKNLMHADESEPVYELLSTIDRSLLPYSSGGKTEVVLSDD